MKQDLSSSETNLGSIFTSSLSKFLSKKKEKKKKKNEEETLQFEKIPC